MNINQESDFCPASRICQFGTWQWNLSEDRILFSSNWKKMVSYEEKSIRNSLNEWLDRVHEEDKPIIIQSFEFNSKLNTGSQVTVTIPQVNTN